MTRWTDALDDPEVGFVQDMSDSDDVVLVVFGSLLKPDVGGIPPFEFCNLVADVGVGKIFIRDLGQVWYHAGVLGLGETIPEVAKGLSSLLAGRRRVVFLGHSSGGYAAMLFGAMIGVDQVVATSPQTYLSRVRRRIHHETRWRKETVALHQCPTINRSCLDLKRALKKHRGPTQFDVYFGAGHHLDVSHAHRLRTIPAVTLHPLPEAGHSIVRRMRDDGKLLPIIHNALGVA